MAKYSANNLLGGTQQNLSSTFKTMLSLTASSATQARRAKLYEIWLGTDGTPANNALDWDVSRQTAAGSGGAAVTPNPLDSADSAALTVAYANPTGEPTITATSSLYAAALNQQLSYRWQAKQGSELVIPATNLAGLAIRAKSAAYTSTAVATALFEE